MSEQQFRPRGFTLLPPVVKNLLIINTLMFIAQIVADSSFGVSLEELLRSQEAEARSSRSTGRRK